MDKLGILFVFLIFVPIFDNKCKLDLSTCYRIFGKAVRNWHTLPSPNRASKV